MLDAKRVFVSLRNRSLHFDQSDCNNAYLKDPEGSRMVIDGDPVDLFLANMAVRICHPSSKSGRSSTRAFYRPYDRRCDFFCPNLRAAIVVKAEVTPRISSSSTTSLPVKQHILVRIPHL
jgi:hypothetical protein